MSPAAFLDELRRQDIRVSAAGDRLQCSAPAGALTPELRRALEQRKAQILEFLRTAEQIARAPGAIVPMQPCGSRTPIFALAGHNGDVFAFRDLARHLGREQPFYGLEPPGLDGKTKPFERVEDLAAYLAAQIRAVRPRGPYIIAGYCSGGAGALELARCMLKAGDEVTLLALFGCPHPALYRFSLSYWGWRMVQHTQALARLSSFRKRREYLLERVRARLKQLRDERTPVASDPVSLTRFAFQQATMAAVRRYTPGRYPGRVCLFIPHRQWLGAKRAALRWRSALPHIEAYYGPDSVDAERMLVDPHAAVFAGLFEQCREASPP